MVNNWWTIHKTLGNMVETAKHTQETLEFDELSKLFLKSRNNIPTYPNISQHIPTYPNISQHFPTKDTFQHCRNIRRLGTQAPTL